MTETKEKTKGVGGNGNLIPCKPGETHNPNGRPKGQRNYLTIYREALRKIAEAKNMSPDELEDLLVQSGLDKALKGDFAFYRDVMDRVHGKPLQKIEDVTDKVVEYDEFSDEQPKPSSPEEARAMANEK